MSGVIPAQDNTADRNVDDPESEGGPTIAGESESYKSPPAENENIGHDSSPAAASQITVTIPGGILPGQRILLTLDRNGNVQEYERNFDPSVSQDKLSATPGIIRRPTEVETVVSEGSMPSVQSNEGNVKELSIYLALTPYRSPLPSRYVSSASTTSRTT
jgi:hypothetical protein